MQTTPFICACLCSIFWLSCKPMQKDPEVLRISIASSPETFDPRFSTVSFVSSVLSQLVFASLCELDEQLLPKPLLAESFQRLDDKTYYFKLRNDIFFHNNKKITSRDVIYTLESLMHNQIQAPSGSDYAKAIEALEYISPLELKVILKQPLSAFLTNQICGLGIVSEEACKGKEKECQQQPVGSGPFRLSLQEPHKNTWHFKRHGLWFEKFQNPIKALEVKAIKDSNTRILELLEQKTDFLLGGVTPSVLPMLLQKSYLRVIRKPGLGYTYMGINVRGTKTKNAPETEANRTLRALAHEKVRKALAMALDRRAIIQHKFHGNASLASGMLPFGHWAKSFIPFVPFNEEEAKKLLDEAGFLDRKGLGRFYVTLSVSTDRFRQSLGLIYAQAFKKLGIRVEIRVQDIGSLYQDIKKGSFHLFSGTWIPVIEPDLLYFVFHSENIPLAGKGGGNRGGYVDLQVDDWLIKARNTFDLAKRKSYYLQVERRLVETLPYIPLWFEDEVVVHHGRLLNYEHSRRGTLSGLRKAFLQR